jgi:hypothetical protein
MGGNMLRNYFYACLALALLTFPVRAEFLSPTEGVSAKLERLFNDDQAERLGGLRGKELQRRDAERRARVDELLAADLILEPADLHHAAMIFQHSPDARDILKAHVLASAAAFEGHERARWLAAASLDRYLTYRKEEQFFGTQFERDEAGLWVPGRTDAALAESLRDAYELASREELEKRAEEFNGG